MSRPLRIEFPGALYHVTSRGDRREDIFVDDMDRARLLAIVAQGLARFDAGMLAYCLMGNHYHFVVYTRQGSLSALMRHINGVYTQAFNRRHGKVGHLFQGRFKAILVDKDSYLLEVCRYVELNPVRAEMVAGAADWPWSSYRVHIGHAEAPEWLCSTELWGYLLGRDPCTDADRARAQRSYAELVAAGREVKLWDEGLNRQIYLGDDEFAGRMLDAAQSAAKRSASVPKVQRSSTRRLAEWLARCETREEAYWRAYTESGLSMTAIAKEVGLTLARVSQLIAKAERNGRER
ncbi:transposase [Paucibacter sp. KBW04]|uniref:transposase n=1 Tax=Paucibacter sp. KBW04 TaxID=2153361 RepID=UPI000F56E90A|nr:transposase [Paucibacter sp. KBW04]RQO59957.1 transposase [Paucibacter sp. KBW04]